MAHFSSSVKAKIIIKQESKEFITKAWGMPHEVVKELVEWKHTLCGKEGLIFSRSRMHFLA